VTFTTLLWVLVHYLTTPLSVKKIGFTTLAFNLPINELSHYAFKVSGFGRLWRCIFFCSLFDITLISDCSSDEWEFQSFEASRLSSWSLSCRKPIVMFFVTWQGCWRSDNLLEALQLMDEVHSHNLQLQRVAFNFLIFACFHGDNLQRALSLLSVIKVYNLLWVEASPSILWL
jgi:hypothetical protein